MQCQLSVGYVRSTTILLAILPDVQRYAPAATSHDDLVLSARSTGACQASDTATHFSVQRTERVIQQHHVSIVVEGSGNADPLQGQQQMCCDMGVQVFSTQHSYSCHMLPGCVS
jgi:hypothetical protein